MAPSTSVPAASFLEFAGFRLDTRQRRLLDPLGAPVPLNSRAFDTLLFLVERPGQTLAKQDIIRAVWPRVVVEENNLSQAISALRKALRKAHAGPELIVTVPGRGYCFTGEVSAADAAPAEPERQRVSGRRALGRPVLALVLLAAVALALIAGWPAREGEPPAALAGQDGAATTPRLPNSIAVLPFRRIGAEPQNGFFTEGLHDAVITQLARLAELNVISRSTMLFYADTDKTQTEIARELNVETVLEGSVNYAGEAVRVNLQLSDPETGVNLWSDSFEAGEGSLEELFRIQRDIARDVAAALQAAFPPLAIADAGRAPTASPEAYQYFLAGQSALRTQSFSRALDLLELAVEADPEYVEAWATLANLHIILMAVPFLPAEQHLARGIEAASRAVALAPASPRGHAMLGFAMQNKGDWQGAAAAYRRALEVGGSAAEMPTYALFQMAVGDFQGARETLESGLAIDPMNQNGRGFLMVVYELLGEREKARATYALGESLQPVWWGDTIEIWLSFGRETAFDPALMQNSSDGSYGPPLPSYFTEESLQSMVENREFIAAGSLLAAGIVAMASDEPGMALQLMESGLKKNWLSFYTLWLPVFDAVREGESFKRVLRESGLVDYWRAEGWPDVCEPVGDGDFSCAWRAYPEG